MANPEQFSRHMVVLAHVVGVRADTLVRTVALVVDEALVLGTPVDTGFARSNWLVSIGSGRTDTIAPYSPGNRLGINEGANAQGALQQGFDIVQTYKRGQAIYITNNAHYIEILDTGHSQQAPSGFMDAAIQKGLETIQLFSLLK